MRRDAGFCAKKIIVFGGSAFDHAASRFDGYTPPCIRSAPIARPPIPYPVPYPWAWCAWPAPGGGPAPLDRRPSWSCWQRMRAGSAAPGGGGRGAYDFRAECRYPWPLVVSTPRADLRCPRVLGVSVTLPLANTPRYPSIPLNTPDTPHFSFRSTPETFPNLSSICKGIRGIQRGMNCLPRGIAGPSIGHPRAITHSDTL
jgi:hypothetical protein